MIAKRVFYEGQVQGVGFRFSTTRIAEKFTVFGWVRNLPDGRVEIQVKGESDQVHQFLSQIRDHSHLASYIRRSHEDELPVKQLDGVNQFLIR